MPVTVETLPVLPRRPREAHKGDFGRILVVGGSPGLTGAGCMSAVGAQKAGGGLVTVAVPQSLNTIYEVKLTSCMSLPMPEAEPGALGEAAAEELLERAPDYDAVAVGPGLGRHPATAAAVRRLVAEMEAPVVVDADGLNALAGHTRVLRRAAGPRLLTPHPGEMARLTGADGPGPVQADRRGVARRFAAEHGVLLALKGAGTVVTDGDRIFVNPTGNPGMATGGTGDVLTGLAAGLLCQGPAAFEALQLAVFVHGLAGDMAAREEGELSMTADDLIAHTSAAFRSIAGREGEENAERVAERALAGREG